MTRTTIGHHTTISPGVTICGDVVIGNRVLIGAGATICEKVWIEDDVTIGAGAVVLPGDWLTPPTIDTPGVIRYHHLTAGGTYVGVPARLLP
jgi:carbonic anhydrase/acetyltransferase-like protein (isoleucine patch superfamily)